MLEEIVLGLENKVRESLKYADLNGIFRELTDIKDPSITLGVGGSKVCSLYLEKVLERKNGVIVRDIDIDEFFENNYNSYKNMLVVSYSGKNHGVKSLMKVDGFKKYLLTSRRSKIKDEILLRYENDERIKSFISIEDMFIPLAIILSYHLGTAILPSRLFEMESFNFIFKDRVDIIFDYESRTAAKFLEVSLVESGVAHVTLHTKYSLCHGRSNTISSFDSLVVYFSSRDSDIDRMFENNLPKITNNMVLLKSMEKDKIVGDFSLTWKVLCLINYISKEFGKEFVSVKYNKIIPTIYNFKGDF